MIKRWISIVIVFSIILAALPQMASADPIDKWNIRSPLPTSDQLNSIAFGNSTYVAVGINGTIVTSSDGVNWTKRTSSTTYQLLGITFGNSIFVAVGVNGTILTSSDGVNWTSRTSGTTKYLTSVAYGKSTFVALGVNGTLVTSSDGTTWTLNPTIGASSSPEGVTFGNNKFVAVGAGGITWTSSNGTTWTVSATIGSPIFLYGVTYGSNIYVAVGISGAIWTSSNGTSWTSQNSKTSNTLNDISLVNNTFVAVGDNGTIVTSSNGTSWTNQTSGTSTTNNLQGVTYASNKYVAVGAYGTLLNSSNVTTWTNKMRGFTNNLGRVSYGNGTYVALGENGVVLTSIDGVNWTSRASGITNTLVDVTYGNGTFVASGQNGEILTSSDGASWISRTSGVTVSITGITYANGKFVTVGYNQNILASVDGEIWTRTNGPVSTPLRAITYGNGTFVAVGDVGVTANSSNGVTWSSRSMGTSIYLYGVGYGNGIFVAVGNNGKIATSSNGAIWTNQTSGTTNLLSSVTYGNGTFVAVGEKGTILTSSNGVNWTNRSIDTASGFGDAVFGSNAFVLTGGGGMIVQSDPIPPAINSVSVSPDSASITQGGSKQLSATVDALVGFATTVTWSSTDAGNKVAVSSTGNVTVASNAALGDYTITATSTVDDSKKGTATITVTAALAAETTPTAGIDYAAEQLTGLASNGSYTIKGTAVMADGSGKAAIDSSWLGTTVNVVKKGNGTTTTDSAAQALSVPTRPAAPAAGKTNETFINGNNGSLTNVTSAMEYKKGSGSWTSISGTSVTSLAPDTYAVRVKATTSAFASVAQIVTIAAFVASTEATPTAGIDYMAEQLTGLAPNNTYTINGTTVTADGSGKAAINGSWLGTTVNVVKKGNGTTTTDSAAQALSVPTRPATPTAGKTNETSINGNNGSLTNVTSAMEYKKGSGGWASISGTSVTSLAPDTYAVRVKATTSAFASVAQIVTIAAFVASPEATPVAGIDYTAEQLTGLAPNGAYTIKGTAVTVDGSGKAAINGSWLGTTVNVVKKGNGTTTTDSAAQTLSLPARPTIPTAGKTNETSINGNDGTLTNVTSAMEYKKGTAGSWTDVIGTSITSLTPDTYYVRVKATSSAFASEAQQVTISMFGLSPEATPAAGIDYAAEQLTGLEPNDAYIINGTTVTADGSGEAAINGGWLGATVNVVKSGNGTTTTDSAAQTLSLPARPETPAAGKTNETSINGNDGTLTNVTSTMEYKTGTAGSWTDVTGTSVTGLTPDTYYVRVKATSSTFASVAQTITISTFGSSTEATPAVVIDYAAEELMGLEPNDAYIINGTTVTADGSGKAAINSSWLGATVNVVKKGNGATTTDSAAQTLSLPARPDVPVAGKTNETSINGHNGTLTNVTSAMEYKQGTDGSWTEVTGTSVTGLTPDTYYVRVKATSSTFASVAQTITISTFGSSTEATPAVVIDYAAEELTGLEPNRAYIINGTTVTADDSGKAAINGSWLGATVNVVKKGNGTTTTDSAAQTLSLPARQAAPVSITVTDITYNGANDGSILNVNLAMEYKKGNTGTWTNTTGTSIVALEPGGYYVRVAATETAFASIPAQVTIHDSDETIPAAPNVSADDASNVIVGLDTTMAFSVDGGAYVRYDGTNMPQLSGEHTVQVRVAASGSVPAGPPTTLIFTTNVSVPAGGLTVTAGDPSGSAKDGKTRITATPAVDGGHRLVYFNFGSDTVVVPNIGDTLSGYLNVPSDHMIPAANGDKIGIAEVDAQGRVVKFGQTAAIVFVEQPGPQPTNEASTGPNEEAIEVLINGKVENAGKATTMESGGIKTTTVVVDPAKLKTKLEAEGVNAVVTIPVKSASNVIVGELNGQMVKNMENLSATLVLQTGKGSYTLPAKEINIDEIVRKFGSNVKLEDIQLKISVAQTPDTMAKVVENAEAKGEFSVVAPALDFTVTGTYGGKTVEVTTYNVYVERIVALPEGIDPNKITTGVVVEPDGAVRHVPTKIVLIEGKYYAEINSLTNSTYTVVWHPLEFLDVASHWAKVAVNDMGSRMVIDGTGGGLFDPDSDITRAEFAAILVRGLGVKLENRSTAFSDVKTSDWFGSAINTAYAYRLISGFEDGTFRPNDKITREQAMAILSRAMVITGLKAQLTVQSEDATLRPYGDASVVSGWARGGVADSVQAGLVSGRSATELASKASITRAEVATLIQRLLQMSGLI